MMNRRCYSNNPSLLSSRKSAAGLSQLILFAALLTTALVCAGCSLDEDTLQQALDKAQRTTASSKTWSVPSLGDDQPGEEQSATIGQLISREMPEAESSLDAVATVPFPDRLNPFEFGEGVDFDAPQTRENKQVEIKLFGFVGTENPQAILNVDGRTKTLIAGEKWGGLEVLEVKPPTVRIKFNQVIRVWSLLEKIPPA